MRTPSGVLLQLRNRRERKRQRITGPPRPSMWLGLRGLFGRQAHEVEKLHV